MNLIKYHRVFITGDTHRSFDRIEYFCAKHQTSKQDLLIILGDAGINYYGFLSDLQVKEYLGTLPITILCIHGNHEQRPTSIPTYTEINWNGGLVYQEDSFPPLLFAKDGEIYDINGFSCIALGGAYRVDKMYRVAYSLGWWSDEQPSAEIKEHVSNNLERHDWTVNYVFSHTVSIQYEPIESFKFDLDQTRVDKTTEIWLGEIEERLSYKKWFCAHYHICKVIDRHVFMFENYEQLIGYEKTSGDYPEEHVV